MRGFDLATVLRDRSYPAVEGVPILLDASLPPTIGAARASIDAISAADPSGLYADAAGISAEEIASIRRAARSEPADLAVIRHLIPATNGRAFTFGIPNRVPRFPDFPVRGSGLLLDIGCNWGRWSISAARAGFTVVGIDPSLGALIAGRRLAARLGIDNVHFVCGDARSLPFVDAAFDHVFSYSVLQHFDDQSVTDTMSEVRRVLQPSGSVTIQMAHTPGPIGVVQRLTRPPPKAFDVRYRSASRLRALFAPVGPIRIATSGVIGLGLEPSLRSEMTKIGRVLSVAGSVLKPIPGSRFVADSVWCHGPR